MSNKSPCRFCQHQLHETFVDLGLSPLANSYVKAADANKAEKFYPLHTYVCSDCYLVQLEQFESPDHIFSDYLYFSSVSESWLRHASDYANAMSTRFRLGAKSHVVELASNDGYLLQYFVAKGVPVLGVEPAANVAEYARKKGVETEVAFFSRETATRLLQQGKSADLIAANNVLAHVPDLNDFVGGMKILLKPDGVITVEFPHLLNLVRLNQFDTIYHEHFSYFSFFVVQKVFAKHGMKVFDVEELTTHGGSLRIFACHSDSKAHDTTLNVENMLQKERAEGMMRLDYYRNFGEKVKAIKRQLLTFLIDCKQNKKTVIGYGAPAKGNTLLNYCGIRTDFLDFTVDRSPHKQGYLLPGVHIPIMSPDQIAKAKPDYVLILPWNLKDEIMKNFAEISKWGGRFVVPIPKLEVMSPEKSSHAQV
jgi:2-polyprenyl-3-methyl-5-hydroxy-6-metoxy-1,4-benzoquinol methylase